jgi:two-component system, cell cycle sensor histidine kinase and response regulator CckA
MTPDPVRILLLEDTPEDAEFAARAITEAGLPHTMRVVADKKSFLEAIENFKPAIILSDLTLNGMDGMDVLHIIQERVPELPLIIITGSTDEEIAVQYMKSGVDDYISKAHIRRLAPAIESAMRRKRMVIEKRAAEQALEKSRESQRLQSAALESAANAVVLADRDGNILWVNPAFTKLTGYTFEEVIGKNPRILSSGKHEPAFYEDLWKTVRSGNVWRGEIINRRKDGTLYTEEMTITPVLDGDNDISHYIAIKEDVTRQKMLQRHMIESQKMESVGTLASGIAHDFNNILGIVLGYLTLLERDRHDDEKYSKSVHAITKAIQRGANLVQQILTFARKTDTSMDLVRVNSIIEELSAMLAETFPRTISIEHRLGENLPILIMDQGQFHQTIMNLCINARDAILETNKVNGAIKIETAAVQGTSVRKIFPDAGFESYVSVSVSDDGCGMDEETIKRIYEPFYTYKKQGKGSGLGLSVVYGVVNAYQGFIDVKSEIGAGTVFTLYFPEQTAGNRPAGLHNIPTEDDIPGGTETILFIEDEQLLAEAVRSIFEQKGYSVIMAADGMEAVSLYTKHMHAIDLVVSDIGLPKISGYDVYSRIREIRADVPFIFASGYFDPALKNKFAANGIYEYVKKPYQPEAMLRIVRRTLDSRS